VCVCVCVCKRLTSICVEYDNPCHQVATKQHCLTHAGMDAARPRHPVITACMLMLALGVASLHWPGYPWSPPSSSSSSPMNMGSWGASGAWALPVPKPVRVGYFRSPATYPAKSGTDGSAYSHSTSASYPSSKYPESTGGKEDATGVTFFSGPADGVIAGLEGNPSGMLCKVGFYLPLYSLQCIHDASRGRKWHIHVHVEPNHPLGCCHWYVLALNCPSFHLPI
jgi:hypothetical protein